MKKIEHEFEVPSEWVDVFGAETYSDCEVENAGKRNLRRDAISRECEDPNILLDFLRLFKDYVKDSYYDYCGYKVALNNESIEKIKSRLIDAICDYPVPEGENVLKAIEHDKTLMTKRFESHRPTDMQETEGADNYIRFFAKVFGMQFDQSSAYLKKIITLHKDYSDISNRVTDVWKDITGGDSESYEESAAYKKYQDAMLSADELPNFEPTPYGH